MRISDEKAKDKTIILERHVENVSFHFFRLHLTLIIPLQKVRGDECEINIRLPRTDD